MESDGRRTGIALLRGIGNEPELLAEFVPVLSQLLGIGVHQRQEDGIGETGGVGISAAGPEEIVRACFRGDGPLRVLCG